MGGMMGPSSVLRRYSDFLWLYERLLADRAGAIIPPIPEKQPVGRLNPAFVEDRRGQLEKFLRRVAVHPELADCQALDTFLRADDHTFQSIKQTKIPAVSSPVNNNMMMGYHNPAMGGAPLGSNPTGKKEGLKRWFAEAKTSVAGNLVRSVDDDMFEEISRYIHGLDNQMRNVVQQAAGLVRKGKEIANGLFEFGLAFNLLGQSEADALGEALRQMGITADQLSVQTAEHADKELIQFEEPLQDYIKMIHAVKIALQKRHEKRVTYSTCVSEVESKGMQLHKLRSQIGQEAKAYTTEMSLRRAQEAADAAQHDFATVSQRLLRDVDRFKRDKAAEMRTVVLNYIQLQVAYNKKMEQAWSMLVPLLERVQLDPETSQVTTATPAGPSTNGSNIPQSVPSTPPHGSGFSSGNGAPPLQPEQVSSLQSHQPQYSNVSSVSVNGQYQLPQQTSQPYGQQQIQPQMQQAPPVGFVNDASISVQYRE
jgi:sorting nexin-1/2